MKIFLKLTKGVTHSTSLVHWKKAIFLQNIVEMDIQRLTPLFESKWQMRCPLPYRLLFKYLQYSFTRLLIRSSLNTLAAYLSRCLHFTPHRAKRNWQKQNVSQLSHNWCHSKSRRILYTQVTQFNRRSAIHNRFVWNQNANDEPTVASTHIYSQRPNSQKAIINETPKSGSGLCVDIHAPARTLTNRRW